MEPSVIFLRKIALSIGESAQGPRYHSRMEIVNEFARYHCERSLTSFEMTTDFRNCHFEQREKSFAYSGTK